MAAQVSARDLGGPSPISVKQKPYRKLKAAKKQPIISGPMSPETLGQIGIAMRQLAETQQTPEPPIKDAITQKRKAKRAEAKAKPAPTPKGKQSKKGNKAQAKPQPSKPRQQRLAELREKYTGGRPMTSQPYSEGALALVAASVEFDIMQFLEGMKAGHTADAFLYLRICCNDNPQVMQRVMAQHAAAVKHVAQAMEQTEYGKVIPRIKTEPAVHPVEKVRVRHVRSRTKYIPAGIHKETGEIVYRKRKQRKARMISAENLAWIELHTPTNAQCDLLVTTRKGDSLVDTEWTLIKERQPITMGNLNVGWEVATRHVEIPARSTPQRAKVGHLAYPIAAMRSMYKSHRSQKRRARLGQPKIPGLFQSDEMVVTVGEVPAAANDDSPPWDDSPPPPPTAVNTGAIVVPIVAQPLVWAGKEDDSLPSWWAAPDETTFFNEVVRQRKINEQYQRKKFQLTHDPSYRRELERRIEDRKALNNLHDRMCSALKIRRIRAQVKASWSEPNYHADISHPPKPYMVGKVTHNQRTHHYTEGMGVRLRMRYVKWGIVPTTSTRLLRSNFDWYGLQPSTRKALRRVFHQEMRDQKDYVRNQLWMMANDITLGYYHDDKRYDQWCMQAENNAHHHDAISYQLQMHLLNMEHRGPSVGYYRDPKWTGVVELFDVKHYERLEVRQGRVASLADARRRRLDRMKAEQDREEEAKERQDSQATALKSLNEALSGSSEMLQGLNEEERTAYFDTIAGRRDSKLLPTPRFSLLKSVPKPDSTLVKHMFDNWVKKDGGIILPPE